MAAVGLHVNVLGPLQVVADGDLLPLTRDRERSLIALLAARAPAVVSTDQLIEDLWADDPPQGARTTLRAYVSTLRRTLRAHDQTGLLTTGPHGYALSAPASDHVRFVELLAAADDQRRRGDRTDEAATLRAALGLWRGRALEEVASVPSIIPLAATLEDQRLVALERWSDAELSVGRHAELSAALTAVCEAHPTRERLWAYRMRALYRSGAHADALGVYRELYRRLRDELGIEPSAELRALEMAVLRQDPSLDGDHVGADRDTRPFPASLRAPRSGPFVGRLAEMGAIDACAALTRSGSSHLVVVSGDPGAGKTRLVSEWAARASRRGWSVVYGRCDRDDATPFQPFVEALSPLLSAPGGLEAADPVTHALFGAAPPEPPAAPSESVRRPRESADLGLARWRLFDAITELVVTLATRTPLTLLIDDLHWADASSLELLRHLSRRAGQASLLVVVTCRPGRPGDQGALADLAVDPGFRAIVLDGLSQDEVGELAAASPLLGGRAGQGELHRLSGELHRLTGGNPLLLRQSLAQLEVGAPDGDDEPGRSQVHARDALPGITDVIAMRLGSLSPSDLETLTVAAFLGEEFGLTELEAVQGSAAGALVLEGIEAALRTHLIAPVAESIERYRFSHDLLRQGLFDRMSAPRRARLHERIGEALAALSDGDGRRLISLAGHFAAAARPGHVDRAAQYALRAAGHALNQLAFEQAAQVAQRGLDCLAIDGSEPSSTRCELELLLAQARLLARDIGGCKQAAERAGADARKLGASGALARAAILSSYLNRFGEPSDSTRRLCEDALAAAGDGDPVLAAGILAGFADYVASSEGDAPAAVELSREALELARRGGDESALARALFVHADVLEWSPDLERREALAAELRALAIRTGDSQGEANALQVSAHTRLQRGDVAGFDADVARIEQLREQIDYWYTDMFALLWRGMRALLDDRLDDVERHAEALLEHARHEPNVVNLYMGQLFLLRREQGRLDELERPLAAAVDANPGVVSFRCALALALAELGAPEPAGRLLCELAVDRFAVVRRDATFTTSLTALADAAATVGDADSAALLVDLLAPYSGRLLIATKGMACLGAADRLLGRLLMTCGDLRACERHLNAALALERRTGSELLLARTRLACDELAARRCAPDVCPSPWPRERSRYAGSAASAHEPAT